MQREREPESNVFDHIRGPLKSANYELGALQAIAQYDIATALSSGPMTADQLASLTDGINPQRLYRALRFLSVVGKYVELDTESHAFTLTKRGEELLPDHPGGAHFELMSTGSDEVARLLPDTLRSDVPSAFFLHTGMTHWQFLQENPDQSRLFDKKMEAILQPVLPFIEENIDGSDYEEIIDIGGGNGTLLKALRKRYPDLPLRLFDLPDVVKNAAFDLAERGISMYEGNFSDVDHIPDFDAQTCLVMSRVLHDWSDEDAIVILKNLKSKSRKDTELKVFEMVMREEDLSPAVAVRDMTMMLLYGDARERTLDDFERLFEASGWKVQEVITGPQSHVAITIIPQ